MSLKILALILMVSFTTSIYGDELGRKIISHHGLQVIVSTYRTDSVQANEVENLGRQNSAKQGEKEKKDLGSGTLEPRFQLNKMMTLVVEIEKVRRTSNATFVKECELSGFEARMPEHNHGMIVNPRISKLDNFRWKIEGFKLHMKGLWRLDLTLLVNNKEEKFSFDFHA